MYFTSPAAVLAGLCALSDVASASPLAKRADLRPVISSDFPDPSIIKVGNTWYAFASQSEFDFRETKVQVATSPDFNTWTRLDSDVLAQIAPWAATGPYPKVWAPAVSRREDGKFLMYYSALAASDTRFHCLGTAVADDILGPYNSNADEPFACPLEQGGALDASYFRDGDRHFSLYKIDANSMGNGGVCGNGVEPIVKTPIVLQEVEADGTTKIGDPMPILDNSGSDGPLVEAPHMIRNSDGIYVLFFSSNCYTTEQYDTAYATSSRLTGPFVKSSRPLFFTGTQGLIGPGGGSIADDGTSWAMHGYESRDIVGQRRSMYVTSLRLDGTTVVAAS